MKLNISQSRIVGLIYVILITMLIALLYDNANATEPRGGDDAEAHAIAVAGAHADSDSQAIANGGGGSNGDQVSMNTSQFYALSLMFPNAVDCFTGAQGGAHGSDADKGASGFLGLHILNKSCWYDKLASQEPDVEINARLKCADKHYRNAVAYDSPKKDRQSACIAMKIASGNALIQEHKSEMDAKIKQLEEQKATLLREMTIDQEQCEDAKDRIAEASECEK